MEETVNVKLLTTGPRLLQLFGLYPPNGVKISNKLFILQLVLVFLFYSTCIAGCLSYLIHTIATGSNYLFGDLLDTAALIFSETGMFWILFNFLYKLEMINDILVEVSDNRMFGKPTNIEHRNKLSNYLCIFCAGYSFLGVNFYSLIGILNTEKCETDKIRFNVEKTCGLMALTWVPFNVNTFPTYYIYAFTQTFSCALLCASFTTVMGIFFGMNEILITRIQHLRGLLRQVFAVDDANQRKRSINNCIRYHIEILRIQDKINKCTGTFFFMYISIGSIIIGLLGFQLSLFFQFTTLAHITGWVWNTLMPCYCGQRVKDESEQLTLELYEMGWYKGNVQIQKDLLLMLTRANKEMVLDSEGFCDMSLITFTTILKSAYSVIALLLQFYE